MLLFNHVEVAFSCFLQFYILYFLLHDGVHADEVCVTDGLVLFKNKSLGVMLSVNCVHSKLSARRIVFCMSGTVTAVPYCVMCGTVLITGK